jgi:erythrocyte band 7 integral membrane protein
VAVNFTQKLNCLTTCIKLFTKAKGPGLFFILPCVDNHINVDLRTITFDVPPQEVLTKDSVTVTVDAVCYFRTYNPVLSGI